VSVSVPDQTFIDRSGLHKVVVTPVNGMLEPYPVTMTGVDHTAAYHIRAQRVGRDEPISCVVVGEWKTMAGGTFYFSPSGVMQNTVQVGCAPRFEVSSNWSLVALTGQLVTEFTKPSQDIVDYENELQRSPTTKS
jgi:hypothetical protein